VEEGGRKELVARKENAAGSEEVHGGRDANVVEGEGGLEADALQHVGPVTRQV
jgi:hypothetical protein